MFIALVTVFALVLVIIICRPFFFFFGKSLSSFTNIISKQTFAIQIKQCTPIQHSLLLDNINPISATHHNTDVTSVTINWVAHFGSWIWQESHITTISSLGFYHNQCQPEAFFSQGDPGGYDQGYLHDRSTKVMIKLSSLGNQSHTTDFCW